MATPDKFKCYLQNEAGEYYYINNLDVVDTTTTKTELSYSPEDGEELKIRYSRDMVFYGVLRSMTSKLKFTGDAARILRSIYYTNGQADANAYALFTIEKRLDDPFNRWGYYNFYSAEVDFSKDLEDYSNEQGRFFEVGLLRRSAYEGLENGRATNFEIDIDDTDGNVLLDGILLDASYKYKTGDLSGSGSVAVRPIGTSASTGYIFPMGFYSYEETEYFRSFIFAQSQTSQTYLLNSTPNDANRFIACSEDFTGEATITGEFEVDCNGLELQMVVLFLEKDMTSDTTASTTLFTSSNLTGSNVPVSFTVNPTFNFQKDNFSYFMEIRFNLILGSSTLDCFVTPISFDMILNVSGKVPSTTPLAPRFPVLLDRLISKIGDGSYSLASTYLYTVQSEADLKTNGNYNSSPYHTRVTTGDTLRGINGDKFKTNLNDAMQAGFSVWGLGLGVEGSTIRVERLPYFFRQNSIIYTFEDAYDISFSPATDMLFRHIKAGYNDYTYEKLNGKYEVNSTQEFTANVGAVHTELNMICPYRCDIYGVEYLRGDYIGKDTTDTNSDNSIFMLDVTDNVDGSGNYLLRRYSSPDGTFEVKDTVNAYNVGFWPHKNMRRNDPYLSGMISQVSGNTKVISFHSGKKNTAAYSNINGATIEEQSDIASGYPSDGYQQPKLFIPLLIKFKCAPPEGLFGLIENNPYGEIELIDRNGNSIYGFIKDFSLSVSDKEVLDMVLICSPRTDTNILTL